VIAYFLLMGLVILLGIIAPRHFGYPMRYCTFITFLLFCGGRLEIGSDWFSYEIFYDYLLAHPMDWGLFSEPAFSLVCRVSEYFKFGIIGVNFITAAIYLIGLIWVSGKTSSPWCAIGAALCYYIPALPMGIIRQGAAIGIIFILVANWTKLRDPGRVIAVLFAMTFHQSAIIMLPIVLIASKAKVSYRILFGLSAILTGLIVGVSLTDVFSTYNERYIEGVDGVIIETTAATFHWLLIAIPSGIYIVYRDRLRKGWIDRDLMMIASIGAISLICILPISSAAVTRLAMYFSFVPVILCGMIADVPKYKLTQTVMRSGIFVTVSVIYVTWLLFAESAHNYLPYDNIMF
jgi:hypothetical protein